MRDPLGSQSLGFRGVAMIATAIGAVAVGAFVIGALAIRRLAIRRVVIDSAEFKSLQIRDLTVTRLRAAEVTVSDSLKLPGSNVDPKISSCLESSSKLLTEEIMSRESRIFGGILLVLPEPVPPQMPITSRRTLTGTPFSVSSLFSIPWTSSTLSPRSPPGPRPAGQLARGRARR